MLRLDPLIDEQNIIRVGGRIHLASLSENEKHPIILPQKHHFTRLLIRHMHQEVKHGGLGLTLQKIRQNYWIIGEDSSDIGNLSMRQVFPFSKRAIVSKNGEFTSISSLGKYVSVPI